MSSILDAAGETPGILGTPGEDWRQPSRENPAFACLKRASQVLMLQGPVGPFFDRLALWLQARGCQVDRVVFQGGDQEDCQAVRPVAFRGAPAEWPAFFTSLLQEKKPDCVVLFGQGRVYHKVALERARAIDLPVVVMEEGYFRPGYVTMELGGVNGYSTTLDRFEWIAGTDAAGSGLQPAITPLHFQKMAWHAAQHYAALRRHGRHYPRYQHHRSADLLSYAAFWTRSWVRKALHRAGDRRLQEWLVGAPRPYFFVPLQLEGDTQITQHSRFAGVAEFVVEVLRSFARHAPADTLLVFRQHPHARGGAGHASLIRAVATGLGVADRVHHLVEGDTPVLAQHSLGTVLVNSTVGLQALERGSPLVVLGEAPYRHHALTFIGALDDFWVHRRPPEPEAAAAFLAQVKNLTQAPASIYALRGEPLTWPPLDECPVPGLPQPL